MWWGGLGQNSSQATCNSVIDPSTHRQYYQYTSRYQENKLVVLLLMKTLESSCSIVSLPCVLSIVFSPPPTKMIIIRENILKNGLNYIVFKMPFAKMTDDSGFPFKMLLSVIILHYIEVFFPQIHFQYGCRGFQRLWKPGTTG